MDSILFIDDLGTKKWCTVTGQYHRYDGPAVEYKDGTKYWFVNGELHRENGPAVQYNNIRSSRWFLFNNEYSFAEWLAITPISLEEKILTKLRYG